MTAEAIAALLHARRSGPDRWQAKCPSHDDRQASLSIGTGKDGKVLLRCFAGCEFDSILAAANLKPEDCFVEPPARAQAPVRLSKKCGEISATYSYTDEHGELLFEVIRYRDPKSFRQRRPDGQGGWTWRTEGTRRVLFHLPDVLKATDVFVCEGERDAINLQAALDALPDAAHIQRVATTAAGGANAPWLPTYSESLAGKNIYVLPDNDAPGRAHATKVASALNGVATSVRVVALPGLPEKGDTTDYLLTRSAGELLSLAQAARIWEPPAAPPAPPVPEPPTQAELSRLLRDVEAFFREFCVLPEVCYLPIALWVAHTYIFDLFHSTPYLAIQSPTKGCGKTLVLEILEALAARPWRVTSPSVAALFRKIAGDKATLLLDEIESLKSKQQSETTTALISILNSGYKAGATVPRCVGQDFHLENFDVFSPKSFAAIGGLPSTLEDRAIVINMQRKLPGQKISRWSPRRIAPEAADLAKRIDSAMAALRGPVGLAYDAMPDLEFLHDRQAELFEPLFAILSALDKTRVPELRSCVAILTSAKAANSEDSELGLKLLSDIRGVWSPGYANASSATLVEKLRGLPESPWQDLELNPRKLAFRLRPFGIQTRQIRIGSATAKGYIWTELESVFHRYLASNGVLSETSETTRVNIGGNDDFASKT